MTRLLRNFLLAVLTFIVGVVISPIRFEETGIFCGRHSGGKSYRSSYFVGLWSDATAYPSAQTADEAFQRNVNNAIEVIERTPKFDKEGRKVGERAVLIFLNENGRQVAIVSWTETRFLHSIGSTSLMHVLEFEKNHENY